MDFFYRNSDGDEVLFVHYGTGKVETMFGTLTYGEGDYIIIPVGTIYRVVPDEGIRKSLSSKQRAGLLRLDAIVMNLGNYLNIAHSANGIFGGLKS